MSVKERAKYLSEHYDIKELNRRLTILQDYQMGLYRINEQSEAAYREEDRVMESMSTLTSAIRILRDKEKNGKV